MRLLENQTIDHPRMGIVTKVDVLVSDLDEVNSSSLNGHRISNNFSMNQVENYFDSDPQGLKDLVQITKFMTDDKSSQTFVSSVNDSSILLKRF